MAILLNWQSASLALAHWFMLLRSKTSAVFDPASTGGCLIWIVPPFEEDKYQNHADGKTIHDGFGSSNADAPLFGGLDCIGATTDSCS